VRGTLPARQHVVEAGGDVGVVVEAEHLGLGELAGELGAVALGQAAHGRDPGARIRGGEQLADGLLLGRLDEAARVDEDDIGVLALSPQRPPGRREARGELFGVDLVAGASEGDQADSTGTRHTERVRDRAARIGRARRAGATDQPAGDGPPATVTG
jgi:hypothetical protein